MECAQREQESVAIIYPDVDNFKAYNDHYGHQAGDECLIRVAREIDACVQRSSDVCARYGGEEFIIPLPQTTLANAQAVAERCAPQSRRSSCGTIIRMRQNV